MSVSIPFYLEGSKQHMASFTNTESGQVKLYRQNKKGDIGDNLLSETIPDFEVKPVAIIAILKVMIWEIWG